MRMERTTTMTSGSQLREPGQTTLTIHALSVANGSLALCRMPGETGHYRADLQDINDWKPGLVLSMTTGAEQEAVGALTLGADIQSMASRWFHLPVPRCGIPPSNVLFKWPKASHAARKALVGGGRVLVHAGCGSGRAGMAVLRLMIEVGEPPHAALNRLRSLDPLAVETDEQLAWAISARRV